jgi:uncharacterized protein (TIGR03083 family)
MATDGGIGGGRWMTKDELIAELEREWEALQAAIDGLTDEQLTRMPVVGEWTVKDLLAHIAVWESRLVTALFKAERGFVPSDLVEADAEVDALNAQFYREQKDRPLDRILEDLHDVHLALVNRLEAFPEQALNDPRKFKWMKGEPLSRMVAGDSVEHYREHAEDIGRWRATLK